MGCTAPALPKLSVTSRWNPCHSHAASGPSRSRTTSTNLSEAICVRYCFPSACEALCVLWG